MFAQCPPCRIIVLTVLARLPDVSHILGVGSVAVLVQGFTSKELLRAEVTFHGSRSSSFGPFALFAVFVVFWQIELAGLAAVPITLFQCTRMNSVDMIDQSNF